MVDPLLLALVLDDGLSVAAPAPPLAQARERRELPLEERAAAVAPATPASLQPPVVRGVPGCTRGKYTVSSRIENSRRSQPVGRSGKDPEAASTRALPIHGRSLKTTNYLKSGNALVEERCAKVDHRRRTRNSDTAGWPERTRTSDRACAGSCGTATCQGYVSVETEFKIETKT